MNTVSAAVAAAAYVRANPGCSKADVVRGGFPYNVVNKAVNDGLIRAERTGVGRRLRWRLYPAQESGVAEGGVA